MSTATKSKPAPKVKTASRPGLKASGTNYSWSFGNKAQVEKALTPFQLKGLNTAITVLNQKGIKPEVNYKEIAMGKTKASDS